ncbi:kinase-like protein [Aulographum hederae CBS 113979]|uniref:Kinase-like protein n=1 Tax=Aulographum hederae CBS 113979 TaxID=1176131 RepID=A0A6G1GK48_9PEZI|nr:kinase-like protein [Aulographum hederae CBS 113979]
MSITDGIRQTELGKARAAASPARPRLYHQSQFRLPQLPAHIQPLIDQSALETSRYNREFTEIRMIGKGGYGKVYKAMHRLDGEAYAIKKIMINVARLQRIEAKGEDEVDNLLGEVRALAKLDHPNIVRYHSGWLEFSPLAHNEPSVLTLHLQMAIYPFNLAKYLSPSQSSTPTTPCSPSEIMDMPHPPIRHCFHTASSLHIMLAILDGVQYIHSRGIVHRDIKPGNIFLCIREEPALGRVPMFRIGDFGLASFLAQPEGQTPVSSEVSQAVARLTRKRRVPLSPVGTEPYCAPWNPSSSGKVSAKLDVYSLGIVLCELLCQFGTSTERSITLSTLKSGKLPQGFEDMIENGLGLTHEQAPSGLGRKIGDLILGMIHTNEDDRASCEDVRRTVNAILERIAKMN